MAGNHVDEDRRDRCAQRAAEAVNSNGNAAFRGRKPLRNGLGRCGERAGFAQAEHEAVDGKRPHRLREAGQRVGDGPPRNEERKAETHAELVDDAPGHQVGKAVGEEEPIDDRGVLCVADREVLLDRGRKKPEHVAIDVVENRGKKKRKDDEPAQVRNLKARRATARRIRNGIPSHPWKMIGSTQPGKPRIQARPHHSTKRNDRPRFRGRPFLIVFALTYFRVEANACPSGTLTFSFSAASVSFSSVALSSSSVVWRMVATSSCPISSA
jgi:hypothetical protein